MIVVSACLCGINCKYNGGNNLNEKVLKLLKEGKAVAVCPEQLGGCATPRDPREIIKGNGKDVIEGKAKVKSKKGEDSTEKFLNGAYEALKIAKMVQANVAILKSKSPSCGRDYIYDGTFSGNLIEGNGVTAELFEQNNIRILTEKEVDKL